MNDTMGILAAIGAGVVLALALTQGPGRAGGERLERGATGVATVLVMLALGFVLLGLVGIIGMANAGVDVGALLR